MGPDHHDMIEGARLAGIALVCAVVTAGLVIALGESFRAKSRAEASAPGPVLIRAGG